MESSNQLIAGVGLAGTARKSRWPARLDFFQSGSGLILALFMWGHMFFVSSILISNDAMWTITKFFEGYFVFGRSYPGMVSVVVAVVITLIVVHAFLAVRKFPVNYRQFTTFRGHMKMMRHEDTTLWYWQVFTGFALFFVAAPHVYIMLTHPGMIGPYESGDRVWTGNYWPLYILLLLAVEFHGGIGLYRLAVKWGWFAGPGSQCHPQAAEDAQVGADRVLPRPGLHHARRLHQDRHRACAELRPALRSRCTANGPAGGDQMKVIYTDVLVIGGGLAGLRVAIGAKRRGHDVIILSLVPPKRSHSAAAQGGMQASLANVIKGQGDTEDVHFEDTVRGSDWGADQTRRPDVRQHGAQGRARAGRLGRAMEPRAQGRPHGHHQRPEGHHHRARRSARPRRAARFRRHQEVAHVLRLRRHRPRDAADDERPGDRRGDSRARAHGGHRADPRCRPLLRRHRAQPHHRRARRLRRQGHLHRERRRRAHLPRDHQCGDLRGHRQRARAGDGHRHAGQHGSRPVPPDRHLPRRHPRHRGLPRRRRPAEGRRRPSLHAGLRAREEGARLARRRQPAHGGAHRQGQGRQEPVRRPHLARHHAARRTAHQAQPARGLRDLPLLHGRRSDQGLDPGAAGAALHDGRRAHRPHRREPEPQRPVRRRRSRLLGHARLQSAGRQFGRRDGGRRHDRRRVHRRLLRPHRERGRHPDLAGPRIPAARAVEARHAGRRPRHRGRLGDQGADAGPDDGQGRHLPPRRGPAGGGRRAAAAAGEKPQHRPARKGARRESRAGHRLSRAEDAEGGAVHRPRRARAHRKPRRALPAGLPAPQRCRVAEAYAGHMEGRSRHAADAGVRGARRRRDGAAARLARLRRQGLRRPSGHAEARRRSRGGESEAGRRIALRRAGGADAL